MKNVLLVLVLMGSISVSFAQKAKKSTPAPKSKSNFKIGYIFEDYVFENYIEVKNAEKAIEARKAEFQQGFNTLALDYQTKNLDYQTSIKNIDSLTTEKLNAKLTAVQSSKTKAEEYQRASEKQLQLETGEMVFKIKQDIQAATKQVAKEKGFSFVLNRYKTESLMAGNKTVLYSNDKNANNLSDAILLRLNASAKTGVEAPK